MKVILYDGGETTKRLKTILANLGYDVYYQSGTSRRIISEILSIKPFAVIITFEIQDSDALHFITGAKKHLSGIEPLFFVIGVANNLKLCNILRNAGYDNVYYAGTQAVKIAESVAEYCAFAADCITDSAIHFTKTMFKKRIRSILRRSRFDESDIGFGYLAEAIYLLASKKCEPLDDVIGIIAEKFRVTRHSAYQNIRNTLSKAWYAQVNRFGKTLLSGFAEAPKPKEALLYISNTVAEEIIKAEMKIFDNFSRGNDD